MLMNFFKIKGKQHSAARWASIGIVYSRGIILQEEDTFKIKVADGVHRFSELPYGVPADTDILNVLNQFYSDLPTVDPHVVGELWNDSGTVKISAGP